MDVAGIEAKAEEAARLLRLLANENRLLLLCHLAGGESPVNALAARLGLSQPALSQHLARLREDGLVATRREAQQVFYRVADPRVEALLAALRDIFCPEEASP